MNFTLILMKSVRPLSCLWVLLVCSLLVQLCTRSDLFARGESIDIHFDNKDSGFFLKQTPYPTLSPGQAPDNDRRPPNALSGGNAYPNSGGNYFTTNIADVSKGGFLPPKKIFNGAAYDDRVISVDKFTVFDNSVESSIAIKVNYGPFSTKQTIPSPFIVPDIPLGYFGNGTEFEESGNVGRGRSGLATSSSLDLSVHLVQSVVPRDNPVLRVLFHIGSSNTRRYSKQKLCIILQVSLGSRTLTSSCSPDNEDGVCLAQTTIPATWWTPLPNLPWKKHVKYPPRTVKVSYSVLETKLPPRTQSPAARGEAGNFDGRANVDAGEARAPEESPRRRGRSPLSPAGSPSPHDEDRMINDDYANDEEDDEDASERDGESDSERVSEEDGDKLRTDEKADKKSSGKSNGNEDEETDDFGSKYESNTQSSPPETRRAHRGEKSTAGGRNANDGEPNTNNHQPRNDGSQHIGGQNIRAGGRIGGTDGQTLADDPTTVKSDARNAARVDASTQSSAAQVERITDRDRSGRESSKGVGREPSRGVGRDPSKGRESVEPGPRGHVGRKIINREMIAESVDEGQEGNREFHQQTKSQQLPNSQLHQQTNSQLHQQTNFHQQQKDQKDIDEDSSSVGNSNNGENVNGEEGGHAASLQSPPLGALESQCLGHLSERVQIRPLTSLGSVPLVHARVSYKEYYLDRNLIVLISHRPLYPLSRLHIPVFVYKQSVDSFVLRCRVKSALRIISVENSNARHWNLSADISAKSSSATVTAKRIGSATEAVYEGDEARDPSLGEVLSFLIEVVEESSTELWDEGKLVWTVKYPPETSKTPNSSPPVSQRAPPSPFEAYNSKHPSSAAVSQKALPSPFETVYNSKLPSSAAGSQRAPLSPFDNVFTRNNDGHGEKLNGRPFSGQLGAFANGASFSNEKGPSYSTGDGPFSGASLSNGGPYAAHSGHFGPSGDAPYAGLRADGKAFGGSGRNARESGRAASGGHRREVGGSSREIGGASGEESKNRKVTAKFQIHKDDIYAVLPISKSWQILNTAVLSGRQISQPMKVFIVSQAGKIADVTLQSSCTSEDESVLKVSSSCSSVYVDGTEMRGSSNASILVRYDSYSGLAQFTIWMPEFPLDIQLGDTKLSQIKAWKIASDEVHFSTKFQKKRSVSAINSDSNAAPVINLDDMITEDNDLNSNGPAGDNVQSSCRYKYQQTQVQVYARFVAPDHDTGRTRYLVSRRTALRITDLVSGLMRPADPRIAVLQNNVVFGRSAGRTELQVLSPVSGRVIGAREVRVTNDKVTATHLSVKIVSGLQLNISPTSGIENGYVAETSVTRRLTAQYQEGLLDIELSFSDNTRVSLRDIPASEYLLIVDSLNPQVVAFAPMRAGSKHPRVIAVGEGRGELLRVAFLQPDACRPGGPVKKTSPLLTANVKVEIDFENFGADSASGVGGGQKSDFVQNDGSAGKFGAGDSRSKDFLSSDLRDILIGVPLKDSDSNDQPSVVAQRHSHHTLSINNLLGPHHPHHNANLAPLEIGMYVLLTSFCIAIIIFVLSCVMYASKFKPPPDDSHDPALGRPHTGPTSGGGTGFFSSFSTTTSALPFSKPPNGHAYNKVSTSEDNSHDWVWLGRTPLERTSASGASQSPMSINKATNINRMRLVYNPACEDSTDEILVAQQNSSGSADASHARVIDTKTYCKRDRCNVSPPTVPPHTHLSEEDDEIKPPVPSRTESKNCAMLMGMNRGVNSNLMNGGVNSAMGVNGCLMNGAGSSNFVNGSTMGVNGSVMNGTGNSNFVNGVVNGSTMGVNVMNGGLNGNLMNGVVNGSSMGVNGGLAGMGELGVEQAKLGVTGRQHAHHHHKSARHSKGEHKERRRSRSRGSRKSDTDHSSSSSGPASEWRLSASEAHSPARNPFPGREEKFLARATDEVGQERALLAARDEVGPASGAGREREFRAAQGDGIFASGRQAGFGTADEYRYGAQGRHQVVDIGLVEAVPKYANADVHQSESPSGSVDNTRAHPNIIGNPLFMSALASFNIDDEIDLSDEIDDEIIDDDFSDEEIDSFGNTGSEKYDNIAKHFRPEGSRCKNELRSSPEIRSGPISPDMARGSPDSKRYQKDSDNDRSSRDNSRSSHDNSRSSPDSDDYQRNVPNNGSENRLASYRISPEDDLKLSDMLKRKPRKSHAKKSQFPRGIDYNRMFEDPCLAKEGPSVNPCITEFDDPGDRRGDGPDENRNTEEASNEIHENLGISNNYFEIMKYFNNLKESNA